MSTGTPQTKSGESARGAKGGTSTEALQEPRAMALQSPAGMPQEGSVNLPHTDPTHSFYLHPPQSSQPPSHGPRAWQASCLLETWPLPVW